MNVPPDRGGEAGRDHTRDDPLERLRQFERERGYDEIGEDKEGDDKEGDDKEGDDKGADAPVEACDEPNEDESHP